MAPHDLPAEPGLRVADRINLKKPSSEAARHFVAAAFGSGFGYDNYATASSPQRSVLLARAEDRFNELCDTLLPPKMSMQVTLREAKSEQGEEAVDVLVADAHRGYTPLGQRGEGVRRQLAVMGTLLAAGDGDGHTLLLLDEPERSLHADAQHQYRRFLDRLAESPRVQVVYSTHSPSMIPTARAHRIRVLERATRDDGVATSRLVKGPVDRNFLPVRTSLGLTAADSLLFAPVTLVVEGLSELFALPTLLRTLGDAGADGFQDAAELLDRVHVLAGGGDMIPQYCRMAASQGCRPVVFVDGDKLEPFLEKVRAIEPPPPIVTLPDGVEFEEVFRTAVLFQALRDAAEQREGPDAAAAVNETAWDLWKSSNPRTLPFSKHLKQWLAGLPVPVRLDKPGVNRRAAQLSSADNVTAEGTAALRRLLGYVRQLLDGIG